MPVSRTVIFNDVHVKPSKLHGSFLAACKFLAAVKPDEVILNGDFLDLPTISRFGGKEDEPPYVVDELVYGAQLIREMLRHTQRVTFIPGNHEGRWSKYLKPEKRAVTMAGLKGLDLRSVWTKAGLPKQVRWYDEGVGKPGVFVGRGPEAVLVRHGDLQAGRFGVGINIAKRLLDRTPGQNQVVGHHHRMQLHMQTSLGRVRWAVANGCLTEDHYYSQGGDCDWQRGFTVLQLWDGGRRVTPHLVPMNGEQFCWEGKVYKP